MKKKRILCFLAAILFVLPLLSGCSAEGESDVPYSPKVQGAPENTPEPQVSSITVEIYPVDLTYKEYVELVIQDELPIADAPTQPGESELTQSFSSVEGGDTDIPSAEDPEPNVTVFRYRETGMADGSTFYRIQAQKPEADGVTVLYGTLYPGKKVEWDTNEETLLQKNLTKALLAETKWNFCTQGVYAYNRELTRCVVCGSNVIYTNADATMFQSQNYNADGSLHSVAELTQGDAQLLLNGDVAPIAWSDDPYPTMVLTAEVQPTYDDTELQDQLENQLASFEEQVNGLNQEIASAQKTILLLYVVIGVLAVTNLICLVLLVIRKRKHTKPQKNVPKAEQPPQTVGNVRNIGTVHNIGGRSGQQDSFDVINCSAGTLAVVADGMGGLADGDKVSQKIVATMRADSARIRPGKTDGILCQMAAHANQEVNRMLGASRQYKCGSTLLAVLIENGTMQWITVGDSRIYLYRGGKLLQINREHIYRTELLERAINGKISFTEAMHDPQTERLSSFVGMGELKHVDICLNRLKLCAGDRILLMSDGVFNTLTEDEIAGTIKSSENAANAASILEEKVLKKNAPNQDNFTCVILEV